MVGIVEYLVFWCRNVDRLNLGLAVFFCLYFLCKIEYARVASLGYLPFKLEFEVLELVSKDDVATVAYLAFSHACAVEFQTAVFNCPACRNSVLAIAAPSFERFAVEQHNVTF